MTPSPDTERASDGNGVDLYKPISPTDKQKELIDFVTDPNTIAKAVEGSMKKRQAVLDTVSPTENTEEPNKLYKIWDLLNDHFDTELLSDECIAEIDEAIQAYTHQAVQAFGEKVLENSHHIDITCLETLERETGEDEIISVPVSVITSLLEGEVK